MEQCFLSQTGHPEEEFLGVGPRHLQVKKKLRDTELRVLVYLGTLGFTK